LSNGVSKFNIKYAAAQQNSFKTSPYTACKFADLDLFKEGVVLGGRDKPLFA